MKEETSKFVDEQKNQPIYDMLVVNNDSFYKGNSTKFISILQGLFLKSDKNASQVIRQTRLIILL